MRTGFFVMLSLASIFGVNFNSYFFILCGILGNFETGICILQGSPATRLRNRYQSSEEDVYQAKRPYYTGILNGTNPILNMTRINEGIRTILHGISNFRLSDILRGSFMFTNNEDVRTVGNGVVDSIFGEAEERKKPYEKDDRGWRLFPLRAL